MIAPNLISLTRLGAAPVALWLILDGRDVTAFVVVLAAGLSDAVDGFLARLTRHVTRLGSLLDPVADKALLMAAYIGLGAREVLPWWLVGLVVARDMLILGGAAIVLIGKDNQAARPLMVSKVNTAAQIALAVIALGGLAFDLVPAGWIEEMIRPSAVNPGYGLFTWLPTYLKTARGLSVIGTAVTILPESTPIEPVMVVSWAKILSADSDT